MGRGSKMTCPIYSNNLVFMNIKAISIAVALTFSACLQAQTVDTDSRYMRPFTEDFSFEKSENFKYTNELLWYSRCIPSFTEENTDVLVMRVGPDVPADAGRGPEIVTPKLTHFGTYSARIRIPDVKQVQPNIGAVVGYFTYLKDEKFGLSEIDIEWLPADPQLIYLGTWTGNADQRIGRTVNLATGTVSYTYYSGPNSSKRYAFMDAASTTPKTIPVIKDFDASKRFYVYGFDWYPDRLTWWIEHPETKEKLILWDYTGKTPKFTGIPVSPTIYRLNFWHTRYWPVDTNPKAVEKPAYPYSLEIDWMKYEPFDELNIKWRKENNR